MVQPVRKTFVDVLDDQDVNVHPNSNPNAEKQLVPRYDKYGRPVYVDAKDPNKFNYPNNSFYISGVCHCFLEFQTLAQPTLLVRRVKPQWFALGRVSSGSEQVGGQWIDVVQQYP